MTSVLAGHIILTPSTAGIEPGIERGEEKRRKSDRETETER